MERERSNSAPPALGHGTTRPTTLYFYCTESDYDAILLHNVIWKSGGASAPVAPGRGQFPDGPYATSVAPDAVGANLEAFRLQFYGAYAINLTHYVAFRCEDDWFPRGVNAAAADSPAQFAWHWVGPAVDDWIIRAPLGQRILDGSDIRKGVSIKILDHGRIPRRQPPQ